MNGTRARTRQVREKLNVKQKSTPVARVPKTSRVSDAEQTAIFDDNDHEEGAYAQNVEPEDDLRQLSAEHTSSALIILYKQSFGGQSANRRFKIYNEKIKKISGRYVSYRSIIPDVAEYLSINGYDLIDMGDYFVIQGGNLHDNMRSPPESLCQAAREAVLAGRRTLKLVDSSCEEDE